MDDLINCLSRINVNDIQSFDNSLDCIIDKMNSTTIEKNDAEWDILSSNYSKLLYIRELIINTPNTEKFIRTMRLFLEKIDKINYYYLTEINWDHVYNDDTDYKCSEIKLLLEKSLYIPDIYDKLDLILRSYKILIPIVEYYRNEKYNNIIDDEDFLEQFN
jgi:hypothetical protein